MVIYYMLDTDVCIALIKIRQISMRTRMSLLIASHALCCHPSSAYQCEQELKASLEGWLVVKLRHGDKLPVISNISLNKRIPAVHGETAIHG